MGSDARSATDAGDGARVVEVHDWPAALEADTMVEAIADVGLKASAVLHRPSALDSLGVLAGLVAYA